MAMRPVERLLLPLAAVLLAPLVSAAPTTLAQMLESAPPSAWRATDPKHTLYMDLASGRVVIELAPRFAPQHARNIESLAREHYFDGLHIVRVQDNYVVQWGDAEHRHPSPDSVRPAPPEFERSWSEDMRFTPLPDGDVYAPQVGFSDGLPVAGDRKTRRIWLAHCYGMVGVGRDDAPTSGSGAELYVVIGHAPRHLDRNVALVGRVLKGIERLSSLPRGTAAMGFLDPPSSGVMIQRVRVEADVPEGEREHLEVLRTGTPTFESLVESRRNRRESWYLHPAGRIELCNVPIPVREVSGALTTP